MSEYDPVGWDDDEASTEDSDRRRTVGGRRGAAPGSKEETVMIVSADPGWRVRIDGDGDTVVLAVGAWLYEDEEAWPLVVQPHRKTLDEPPGEYVILQPGEPDDAEF
ncbi:hypothetical protein LX16_2689 [Stackebrandtia albiflava]|uniref:Uncharacterized protein n=1 Tax=Stackebrandtia albiflava TaxID=406432 RepID=A0A562V220_9ACTN|nr:hypothetical protein [Stackebrandtia albiflava]TWJ11946.1 hypothetical protein LX16_2689 [Stackebrandtia albiflava]